MSKQINIGGRNWDVDTFEAGSGIVRKNVTAGSVSTTTLNVPGTATISTAAITDATVTNLSVPGIVTLNDLDVTTNIDTATLASTGTVTLNDLDVTTNIDTATMTATGTLASNTEVTTPLLTTTGVQASGYVNTPLVTTNTVNASGPVVTPQLTAIDVNASGEITAVSDIVSNQYIQGLRLRAGTDTGSDAVNVNGNIHLRNDGDMLILGGSKEAALSFDGTQVILNTDNLALTPADFRVSCGSEKTVVLNEPVWDDLRTPATAIRITGPGGTTPPTEELRYGGIVLQFPPALTRTVFFNLQLPHTYKEGTDIDMHLHVALESDAVDGETVNWKLTYTWTNIGDAISALPVVVPRILELIGESANTHYVHEISASLSGVGKTISSMLVCRLDRDASDGPSNSYPDSINLLEVDAHYQIDTQGSRRAWSKE